MSEAFPSRLRARLASGAPPAVVGLDPRVESLPRDLSAGDPSQRIVAFYRRALPLVARHIAVAKPNIAFFERFGPAGLGAYEETCRLAKDLGMLVIGDIKRGDIDSTAEAYADYHFRHADAVTLHGYLGRDSLAPFLRRCQEQGHGVFVLVRTSNPSASELQDLPVAGERLCDAMARAVDRWGSALGDGGDYSPVGAVVGATRPGDLAGLRALMPRAWFLLPGIGAQGGTASDTAAAFDAGGLGALLSQSRGVMQCFSEGEPDWLAAIERAAAEFAAAARAVAAVRAERHHP